MERTRARGCESESAGVGVLPPPPLRSLIFFLPSRVKYTDVKCTLGQTDGKCTLGHFDKERALPPDRVTAELSPPAHTRRTKSCSNSGREGSVPASPSVGERIKKTTGSPVTQSTVLGLIEVMRE